MKVIKWQYKISEHNSDGDIKDLLTKLNFAGNLGWELVGFFHTNHSSKQLIIFKRPYAYTDM